MKLTEQTLQLFKVALDAYEQETGAKIATVNLYSHQGNHETAAKLEDLGFVYKERNKYHWVQSEIELEGFRIEASYFYTPDTEFCDDCEEDLHTTYYCEECQGYFDDVACMVDDETDLCDECADKIAHEQNEEQKHLEKEYWSTRL